MTMLQKTEEVDFIGKIQEQINTLTVALKFLFKIFVKLVVLRTLFIISPLFTVYVIWVRK